MLAVFIGAGVCSAADPKVIEHAAERVVKLYGAGGLGRVEAYGAGLLVSPDGYILTVLSPLLDTDDVRVVLANGRRVSGKVGAVDVPRELAILKIEPGPTPYPHFDIDPQRKIVPGDIVLAFSNQFKIAAGDEPVSVQQGVLAAFAPLRARQGFQEFTYPGKVYIVDQTTNNAGAAGGALTDAEGRLVGLVGKEVKNSLTETWVNYALPVADFASFVDGVIAGAPQAKSDRNPRRRAGFRRLDAVDWRGIIPLPDVLERTPAFIDGVVPGSPAERAGLKPDDLILFIGETLVQSVALGREALADAAIDKPIRIVVLRKNEIVTVELDSTTPAAAEPKPSEAEPKRSEAEPKPSEAEPKPSEAEPKP